MKSPSILRNALLLLAALVGALCGSAAALELSDIHMPMKRDDADKTLSKDYTSAVLTDGSVRRTWEYADREIFIDFDTVSNNAIMVGVIYKKPVTKKKGIDDAHELAAGKFAEDATWDSPKDRDAKTLIETTYGLKNARRKKLDDKAMLFYETDQKNRIVRVSLFANMPHTNRWALTTLTKGSGKTAMGNQMSSTFISDLYADEERRQSIPLAATAPAPAPHSGMGEPAATTPTVTTSITFSAKPKREKPATPQTGADTPPAPRPEPAAPVATTEPATTPAPATADADKPKLKPGRHAMSLLPPPPNWLKSIGVEEPTWWHYLGVGVVLLLIIAFTIRSMAQSASRAAQRRRFVDVVAQGKPTPKKRRR